MRLLRYLDADIWRGSVTPLDHRPNRGSILRDVALALALCILALLGGIDPPWGHGGLTMVAWTLAVAGIVVAMVVLSRPFPLLALLLAVAATVVVPALTVGMAVFAYLAGRRMPRLAPVLALLELVVVTALVYLLVQAVADLQTVFGLLSVLLFLLVLPWLVGVYRRQQRELADAGWERAKQLEREQQMVGEQMRVRERSRIAQDMHDSLGHELSLIALRAGALEMAADVGEDHRRALGELRANATTATERLQEIIGILREHADPLPLDPAGEDVTALVERVRASGVDIAVERIGEVVELAPMVDRALYRVVQEALTNATKHAPGASVLVRFVYEPGELTVSVYNDAGSAGPLPGATQGQRGLVALAERVRLAGGTFDASEYSGGYRVHAWFSHHAPPTALAEPEDTASETDSTVGAEMRQAHRRSRRGLAAVVGAFLLVTLGGVSVLAGLEVNQLTASGSNPQQYAQLQVGLSRDEVEANLNAEDILAQSMQEAVPPPPEGAICDYYYEDSGELPLPLGGDLYRLCYVEEILVAKDRVEQ